jgi:hypothetical protein
MRFIFGLTASGNGMYGLLPEICPEWATSKIYLNMTTTPSFPNPATLRQIASAATAYGSPFPPQYSI